MVMVVSGIDVFQLPREGVGGFEEGGGLEPVATAGEITIWYEDRGSEMCVISFSHMDFGQTGALYWGRDVLAKLGVSAVGVVCRGNTWFPAGDVRAALRKSGRPWMRHPDRVAYGFSMGGYGALRHGRRFGATSTLALSAQFDGPGLVTRRPSLLDMPWRTFVAFDPSLASDARDARQAKARQPFATLVPLHHVGHDSPLILNSTSLKGVLQAVAQGGRAEAVSLLGEARRRSFRRALGLAAATLAKDPELAKAIAASRWDETPEWWRGWWQKKLEATLLAVA